MGASYANPIKWFKRRDDRERRWKIRKAPKPPALWVNVHRRKPLRVKAFTASWWRCSAKSVPFLPKNVLGPQEYAELLRVASLYGIPERQVVLLFRSTCDPKNHPQAVVELEEVFYPRFEALVNRLLKVLAEHQTVHSLWSGPYRGPERGIVFFGDFMAWLFELCSLDFYSLVVRLLDVVVKEPFTRIALEDLVDLIAFLHNKSGTGEVDPLVLGILRHVYSLAPAHDIRAVASLFVRYPILVQPILRMQWSVQRKFMGAPFWHAGHTRGVGAMAEPLPVDSSLRYCRMLTARTLMVESAAPACMPLLYGTRMTSCYEDWANPNMARDAATQAIAEDDLAEVVEESVQAAADLPYVTDPPDSMYGKPPLPPGEPPARPLTLAAVPTLPGQVEPRVPFRRSSDPGAMPSSMALPPRRVAGAQRPPAAPEAQTGAEGASRAAPVPETEAPPPAGSPTAPAAQRKRRNSLVVAYASDEEGVEPLVVRHRRGSVGSVASVDSAAFPTAVASTGNPEAGVESSYVAPTLDGAGTGAAVYFQGEEAVPGRRRRRRRSSVPGDKKKKRKSKVRRNSVTVEDHLRRTSIARRRSSAGSIDPEALAKLRKSIVGTVNGTPNTSNAPSLASTPKASARGVRFGTVESKEEVPPEPREILSSLLRSQGVVPMLDIVAEKPRYCERVAPPRGPVCDLEPVQVVQLVLEQTKMAVGAVGAAAGGGVPGSAVGSAWFGGMDRVPCLMCAAPVTEADEADIIGAARVFNGFCSRCDQYLYRCVADGFGYRFATVVLEAAAATPPVAEQLEREEQVVRALKASTGFQGRLPPRRFLFDDAMYHVLVDTATKQPFFYNASTGESQWKAPRGVEHKRH